MISCDDELWEKFQSKIYRERGMHRGVVAETIEELVEAFLRTPQKTSK